MQQTTTGIDGHIDGVAEFVRQSHTPADDPEFYGVKHAVRSHLQASIDEPFFFAVEPGDEAHMPASFVLGIGNDIRRVTI